MLEFTPLSDPPGVRITDHVENARFDVHADGPVDPTPTGETFPYPTDDRVTIRARRLEIPKLVDVWVRDADGDQVGDTCNRKSLAVPPGEYFLEVSSAMMKVFVAVESELTVRPDGNGVTLSFGREVPVVVGARSFHERPAGTITVTDDVEDAMAAVSLLSSSLKTTSPERSFPTLRGHPPLVERGDAFSVPDGIDRPETGVRIVVPPSYDHLFPASTLSYYLAAEVVPGDSPRVETDRGFVHPLDGDFDAHVSRVLKQTFLLDCAARTEGIYRVDLHERRRLESRLDLDFADLYGRSLAEQLEAYLSVPYERVVDLVPQWKLTADVAPVGAHVDMLPYFVNDLAEIRCPRTADDSYRPTPESLVQFMRATPDGGEAAGDARNATERPAPPDDVIKLPDTDAVEHAWVGEGFPLSAGKPSVESYQRRLERLARDTGRISVTVVCNDDDMTAEDNVTDIYGPHDYFEFDVDIAYDLTRAELRETLAASTDFLHYVGHVDADGVACADGHLDTATLDEVGVEAFLLNACRSYEQGYNLVERGALGGVVTTAKVGNEPATVIGRAVARLLNAGYSLLGALSIASERNLTGTQYMVVGDGNLELVQSSSGTPNYSYVDRLDDGRFEVSIYAQPSRKYGLGTLYTPLIADNTVRYLNSGLVDTFEVSRDELEEYLGREVCPVFYDGALRWSDELDLEET